MLGRSPGGALLAYVADADEPTLHTFDVDAQREVATTTLRGAPGHVMILSDGRVAVTLPRENLVEIFEPAASTGEPLASRCAVSVPTDPVALATTRDGSKLLVTSGWSHRLSVLTTDTMTIERELDVASEPRAVVVDADGRRAFVAHVVGATMSVVDLESESRPRELALGLKKISAAGVTPDLKVRAGCQGYALARAIEVDKPSDVKAPVTEAPPVVVVPGDVPGGVPSAQRPLAPRPAPKPAVAPARIFAPMVSVDPGESGRVAYYGSNDGLSTEESSVSVIDERAERVITRGALAIRRSVGTASDCLLPRAAAYSKGSVYVACLGIDSLVEMSALAVDPAKAETRRWALPGGPTGVAIDRDADRAVTWSQFERAVSVVPLDGGVVRSASLSRRAGSAFIGEIARGRALYHATGDRRISSEGLSCASCHPDGREDAITWGTQSGPRNTPMLAGRLEDTAPYGWLGEHATLEIHLRDTVSRLRGGGLPPADVQALVAYLRVLESPQRRAESPAASRSALVDEGRALFHGAEAACSTCHAPDKAFIDGARHDVGSGAVGELLDTPSLRFVGNTAPYFHDGRYQTLDAMLSSMSHGMGKTTKLSQRERSALVAYLETL